MKHKYSTGILARLTLQLKRGIWLLPFLAATLLAFSGPVSAQKENIRISVADIESLFKKDENAAVSLSFIDDRLNSTRATGRVKGHINKGNDSGVLSIDLSQNSDTYTLLLSRKPLNGAVKYKIILIDQKTNTWYEATGTGKDGYYRLNRKNKNEIVTE